MYRKRMIKTDKSYFIVLMGFIGAIGIIDTVLINPNISAFAFSLGADEILASFIAGVYSLVAIPASIVIMAPIPITIQGNLLPCEFLSVLGETKSIEKVLPPY